MPERIFCVDFGSAFTKVALRTAAQEDGKLIPCSDEGLELWAPTVVAADWTRSSTEPRLEFGYRAAAIKPGGKIVVSRTSRRTCSRTPRPPTARPRRTRSTRC